MGDQAIAEESFLNSLIGAGTVFQGDLDVNGLLRIDGDFSGSISSTGRVLVGKNGRVRCNIHATNVVVGGGVKGDIVASERVQILSTGMVLGNIHAPRIVLEEGVLFSGHCTAVPDHKGEGSAAGSARRGIYRVDWGSSGDSKADTS